VKQETTLKQLAFFIALFLLATIARAADPYIPTDAERARWTLHDMQSWKIVFEAYKTDHKQYPVTNSLEEARAAAEPVYIKHAPMTDAWGRPYRVDSDGTTFRVVSAGADGIFKPETWSTGGQVESFSDDAVVNSESRWAFRRWEFK
jgi:hypothetical protein